MAKRDRMSPGGGRMYRADDSVLDVAAAIEVLQAAAELVSAGDAEVTVKGSITQPLVTGSKTVSNVAAEIFAGAEPLAGRTGMRVTNVSPDTIYFGEDTISTASADVHFSGDSVVFQFKPDVHVPIYYIASGDKEVRVSEWK